MPSSDLFSDRIVAPHQRRISEREGGEDQFELDILVERSLQPLQLIDHVSQSGLLQGFTEFPDHLQLRSEEHTSELQSRGHLVCRLLLDKKKNQIGVSVHT